MKRLLAALRALLRRDRGPAVYLGIDIGADADSAVLVAVDPKTNAVTVIDHGTWTTGDLGRGSIG